MDVPDGEVVDAGVPHVDGGFVCGQPIAPLEAVASFPELLEIRLEHPAPSIGTGARFVGRVRDEGSGIETVWVGLEVDPQRSVYLSSAVGPDGRFVIPVEVDRCTQITRLRLSYLLLEDRVGNGTGLVDPDGDGVFRVTHDFDLVGQQDIGVLVVTASVTTVAPPILRRASISQTPEGFAVDVTLEGADGCLAPLLLSFGGVDSNGACRPTALGYGEPTVGSSEARIETRLAPCANGGRWIVESLSLLAGDRYWDDVAIEDPDGLLPLTIDLGTPLPIAAVPRLVDLSFTKEVRPEGTVIHASARSEFACGASGSLTFDEERMPGRRVRGSGSLQQGQFEGCTFIPATARPGFYALSRLDLSPEFGCRLDIQVENGQWRDRSRPPSGTLFPADVPRFSHP